MIDLTKVSELKLNDEIIEKIEDINGLVIYEAWKKLLVSGIPPLTLTKCKGIDLVDYKLYGESVQKSILPNEYQQVDYIETDGNQYIDTGVIPSDYPDGIKYVFSGSFIDYTPNSGNNYLFGSLNNSCRSGNTCFSTGNNMMVFLGGAGNANLGTAVPNKNTDFTFYLKCTSLDAKNSEASINDVPLPRGGHDVNSAMPTSSIYLLWCNGVGNTSKPFWGKLYSFTMEAEDGTPIRNFVPCYRKSDNVIGLYDMVEDKFYTNKGTGTFIKGNNAPTLKAPIEIESVGEYDEPTGKYKIPVKVYEPYVEPITTNIYLSEPLRKTRDYADYIDFDKQKVFRNVVVIDDTGTLTIEESYKGVIDDVGTNIELPNIPTIKGTTIIEVDTKVQPSNLEVVYKGKKLNKEEGN